MAALLGSVLGRQSSWGGGSWANTESSPEEQALSLSWPVGEYCSKVTDRSRYSWEGEGKGQLGRAQSSLADAVIQSYDYRGRCSRSRSSTILTFPYREGLTNHVSQEGSGLTAVDAMDRTRSWSSTSCLKVGLWEGTACQHSLMIMYLAQQPITSRLINTPPRVTTNHISPGVSKQN